MTRCHWDFLPCDCIRLSDSVKIHTLSSMLLQDTTPINDLLQHAGSFQLQNNGVNFGHQYLITEFPFLATCHGFCPNTNNRILSTTSRWSDQIVFFKTHSWTCPTVPSVSMRKDTDQYGSLIPGDLWRVYISHESHDLSSPPVGLSDVDLLP